MLCHTRKVCAIALLLLSACSASPQPPERVVTQVQTVTVDVPVPTVPVPPAELTTQIVRPTVQPFVPANDPKAVVGVTKEGVSALMSYPLILERRLNSWNVWVSTFVGKEQTPPVEGEDKK